MIYLLESWLWLQHGRQAEGSPDVSDGPVRRKGPAEVEGKVHGSRRLHRSEGAPVWCRERNMSRGSRDCWETRIGGLQADMDAWSKAEFWTGCHQAIYF